MVIIEEDVQMEVENVKTKKYLKCEEKRRFMPERRIFLYIVTRFYMARWQSHEILLRLEEKENETPENRKPG